MRNKPVALTVGKLIERLSKYDPNLIPVVCREGKGHYYFLPDSEDFIVMEDGAYYADDVPKNDGPSLLIQSH